jgi:type IV secretory pathway ATPase VirB11/archaellum biosynthesis ATPase
MTVDINNTTVIDKTPLTFGPIRKFLEAIYQNSPSLPENNGSATAANGRDNAVQLASHSEPPVQVERAYKPNVQLLGKEVAAAVQFLPENIIKELERKVREKNINPQAIEEFQIDLGRHVRVDTGASSKEAAQNGLGISPLTLLGDPTKESDNVLKIKQEDLNQIKSSIMFNPQSGRGGLEQVEDLSRFSISERNGLPANITIRVGKAVETPLPDEIQEIVLDAVQNKKKVLFLGQTAVGKTTLIRQISKFLSDKGVSPSIFDKSEEIAGHGLTPHSALGHLARRFVIQPLKNVAQSLISMIENHNPKALIIDELSDREQFSGVRRMIDEKGIPTVFIFTHGTTLGKAMHSENIRELLAKVDTVIVGDETAQKTGNGDVQDKIRHNVIGHSMVDVVVEMPVRGVFVVHENTLDSTKKLAAGEEPTVKVYPKGTNIRNYRSEEAEQFIEPKNKLSLPMRPATRPSGVSSTDLSKHEDELEEERHPRTGGKQAKSPPPPPSTSHAQYPLLVKNYKKGEIDSMPLHRLTKLQQQLLGKQKGEGNLPRVQKQLLDWVNAAKERRIESGGETVREFNKKYGFNPTPNQKQALDSLDNKFDQIKEERKEREAKRSSEGQST